MKLRLICIAAAAMLLVGCGGSPESSETSEKPEYTASATTTSAATTTAATSATEPVIQTTEAEQQTGGLVLTDEHKELRKLVSGAKEFCDFEELGIAVTKSEDFVKPALIMGAQNEDFDADYTRRGFDKVLGYDDGKFYFSIETQYGETTYATFEQEDYVIMIHPPEILTQAEYRYDYFCLDCNSGELTQIYSPDEEYIISEISNEAMLLKNGDSYKLIYRESGEVKELPEEVRDTLLVNDTLYFIEGNDQYRELIFWLIGNLSISYNLDSGPRTLMRGVHNAVYFCDDSDLLSDIGGNQYILNDPLGRIRDFATETYYHCTAMTESNFLGWRTRVSITDYSYKETVIGYMQTEEKPTLGVNVNIHATKDGLIFLQLPDTQPIVLLGAENDFSGMKAAFLPEDILPDYYDVFCDGSRLYFHEYSSRGNSVVTLSRENEQALDR